MNGFSLADLTAQPQLVAPVIQQLEQVKLTYTQDQIDSLSGNLLFVACLCIVAGSFSMGVVVGRRHTRHHQLIAIRLRQIQTLERIWQMTTKRRD
ncbi:hypothetical protein [Nostoc sp. NMS4]|uniref:hypothetical protein n=1 Tax=Nostoc sp. NMS4 TaxID=2815390 RepID=UPI0025F99CB2|nr:hypothetical protein [Nostoc sp. NMS4]MBN3924693.1 hypothetical protein [Nostoc sp. NMS4]